jgi:RNA polymerase sigma factor (sigma-70 family)
MVSLQEDDIEMIQDVLKSRIRTKYYRRCRRLGWSHHDIVDWAESVSGLGISVALYEIDKWDRTRGTIACWFYLRANSQARGELRELEAEKRGGKIAELVQEVPEQSYEPFQDLEVRDDVREILRPLSQIQREALVFYEYLGMKVSEISWILQCPAKTVYTHLDRARKKASLYKEREPNSGAFSRVGESNERDSQTDGGHSHEIRPPPLLSETSLSPLVTNDFPSRGDTYERS